MNLRRRIARCALLLAPPLVASCSAPPTTGPGYWPASSSANTPQNANNSTTSDQSAATPGQSAVDSGATAQVAEAGTWHSSTQAPPAQDAAAPRVAVEAAAPPPSWSPASDASANVSPDSGSSSSGALYPPTTETAQDFCNEYQMYCGFGGSMRYPDMATCVMNYNANPQQDGCYVYHLHAAIAGTATLCSSPPTQQCFDIHCPHATGQGGYCN